MNKRKFRVCILLILVLSLCFSSTALAALPEEDVVEPQASLYLSAYSAYMYDHGDGLVSVWFEVQGTGTMDKVGATKIIIQEKVKGTSSWDDAKTCTYPSYSALMDEDDSVHGSNIGYYGTVGNSYRAYVTVYAEKNGGSDSRTILTETIVATKTS